MANERYTNDVLNVAGSNSMPNPTIGDNLGTFNFWGLDLRVLLLKFDAEFALTYAGNPNGNVQGKYVGEKLWDSTNSKVWICTTPGTIGTAVWTDFGALVAAQVNASVLGQALAYAVALGD